jgi:hypothetical protein
MLKLLLIIRAVPYLNTDKEILYRPLFLQAGHKLDPEAYIQLMFTQIPTKNNLLVNVQLMLLQAGSQKLYGDLYYLNYVRDVLISLILYVLKGTCICISDCVINT